MNAFVEASIEYLNAVKDAEGLRQKIRLNVEQMRILRRVRELDFES